MERQLIVQKKSEASLFSGAQTFAEWTEMAVTLSNTTLVPENFRGEKNQGNCLIALDMANRMQMNPLLLMQNLNVIKGKPTLSSKFLVATVNSSGQFSALRYEWAGENETPKELEFLYTEYHQGQAQTKKATRSMKNLRCRAFAIDKKSNEKLYGPWVSIDMAFKEGWFQKKGSKWPNMPEIMLRYRAASFWVNAHAPEIGMGMRTTEEVVDWVEAEVIDETDISNPIIQLNNLEDEKANTSTEDVTKSNTSEEKPEPQTDQQTEESAKGDKAEVGNITDKPPVDPKDDMV